MSVRFPWGDPGGLRSAVTPSSASGDPLWRLDFDRFLGASRVRARVGALSCPECVSS